MFNTTELSKLFSFLLNVLSMFVGVIISRYYQGESIFPLPKTISVSFGSTILYFLMKFMMHLIIEPYGDILICASVGLIAESIFAVMFSNKAKIIEILFRFAAKKSGFDMEALTKGNGVGIKTEDDEKEEVKSKKVKEEKEDDNDDDFLSRL